MAELNPTPNQPRVPKEHTLPPEWIRMAGGEVHAPGPRTKVYTVGEIDARLWCLVEKTETCWLWHGYTRNGYGVLSIHDAPRYLHRLVYAMYIGDIEPGLSVCHHCDVRPCIRPEHLFMGSQLENMRDMWSKGRAAEPPHAYGERHHMATLTDQQVAEIRARWAAKPSNQRGLAREYGVTQSSIWRLVHGITRRPTP